MQLRWEEMEKEEQGGIVQMGEERKGLIKGKELGGKKEVTFCFGKRNYAYMFNVHKQSLTCSTPNKNVFKGDRKRNQFITAKLMFSCSEIKTYLCVKPRVKH